MQLQMSKEQNDETYIKYHPVEEFLIWGVVIDKEEIEIFIAMNQDFENLKPIVNMYMEWLDNCEQELTEYFQEQLGEELADQWMKDIEVYSVSIVFNSSDDYGATISLCAECVAGDHIIELDFEKNEIVDNRLVG